MSLKGIKILLGVSGSIAAYKAAFVIRNFVKEGAEVKVVMTKAATEFITPITLATLSNNEVVSTYVGDADKGSWNNHVDLGLWADVFLIAPATANTLAKMNTGVTDNLMQAVYLSVKCPVIVAPAMDLDMYAHPATQKNIQDLKNRGHLFIDSEFGELASGLVGKGRMAEPEHILEFFQKYFSNNLPLKGKKWLVTAGPTYEQIDPVRFIGNHSSGKMGVALAEYASELGADVKLVSGPGTPIAKGATINQVFVKSAAEMFEQTVDGYHEMDVAILSAAVADYTPSIVAEEKIKKKTNEMTIDLVPTRDILKHLGSVKKSNQQLIGFALETENEMDNARKKIESKNLDLIVLNSLRDAGAGFGFDTNKITLIDAQNNVTNFELKSKVDVAKDIIHAIQNL